MSFSECAVYLKKLRLEGGDGVNIADSIIMSLEGSVLKPLNLRDPAKTLQEIDACQALSG